MRAAICTAFEGPDAVVVGDFPSPELGAGQVRVKVHVAAINFPDVLLLSGTYQIVVPTPFVPGSEFAGVITEVADDVQTFGVGDRVFGSAIVGACADEIVVRAQALMSTPDDMDDTTAAAFGVTFRTAYHVLRSTAALAAGEELVVLGAGGGVGLAAVQLGALLGATVTAVASTQEKLDVAASCGATRSICHRSGDLRQALKKALPGGSDVVIDPVGGDLAEPALRSLHWGGRFVTVGYASGVIPQIPLNLVLLKGMHILGFQFSDFAAHLPHEMARNDQELLDLVKEGRVRPHIGATFSLDQTAEALRYMSEGKAIGKLVIEVDPSP
jgi:NADPH:quinone reductase